MSQEEQQRRQHIIIVGLGPSAVGLIYGLLSPYGIAEREDDARASGRRATTPNISITVLERGKHHHTAGPSIIQDPAQWFAASHLDKSHASQLHSVPQKGLGGRIVCLPTGKGFGGGSLINATLAVRPCTSDFDGWPTQWREFVSNDGPVSPRTVIQECSRSRMRIMDSVMHIESVLQSNNALVEPAVQIVKEVSQKKQRNEVENECEHDEGTTFHRVSVEQCCAMNANSSIQMEPMRFVARYDEQKGNYSRVNYYEGILEPFLRRNPHLRQCITFCSDAQAERLIVTKKDTKHNEDDHGEKDDWVVKGVEYACQGTTHTLMADKVILCAGAFYSPALLMVSGIGDPEQLRQSGIVPLGSKPHDSTADRNDNRNKWSGVGRNLRDHVVTTRLSFTSPFAKLFEGASCNAVRGWIPLDITIPAKVNSNQDGDMSCRRARVGFNIFDGTMFHQMLPYAGSVAFYRDLNPDQFALPSGLSRVITLLLKSISYAIFIALTVMMWIEPLRWVVDRYSTMILVGLLDPKSRGQMRVERKSSCKSQNACTMSEVDILVDPAYLEDERDLEQVEYAWKALDEMAPRLFSRALEILPGLLFSDRRKYAANFALPYFHWSGSCSMETSHEVDWVVDKDLKVRNVRGLHVCDASILPTNVSCNPALLLAATGLTAASFIKLDHGGKYDGSYEESIRIDKIKLQ